MVTNFSGARHFYYFPPRQNRDARVWIRRPPKPTLFLKAMGRDMWDLTWGIGAGAYVVGSLVNGLLDPILGYLLVAIGGGRLMLALWRRYRS